MDPVTPIDVYTATSKIKTKTSKDHDGISTKLVKGSIDNIYIPLTHIINLSLSTGTVPQNMKVARVIPIFKNGEKTSFNNYRPISILPVFSKILEKKLLQRNYYHSWNPPNNYINTNMDLDQTTAQLIPLFIF